MARDDRVGVHLLHDYAAVLDMAPRDYLEPIEQRGSVAPTVCLDEAHDDVGAAVMAAMGLFEHLVCLADAWGHAHVDAQSTPLGLLLGVQSGEHLVAGRADRVRRLCRHFSSPSRSRLSSSTWTPAAPMKPRNGCVVWRATAART